jgi:hypothetical protein
MDTKGALNEEHAIEGISVAEMRAFLDRHFYRRWSRSRQP